MNPPNCNFCGTIRCKMNTHVIGDTPTEWETNTTASDFDSVIGNMGFTYCNDDTYCKNFKER